MVNWSWERDAFARKRARGGANTMARMPRFLRRGWVRIAAGIYVFLWALTATWGNFEVDRHFDREFQTGYDWNDRPAPVTRIGKFYVHDLLDPRNEPLLPKTKLMFFRYRATASPLHHS